MVALLFSADDQPYYIRLNPARNFVHYLANRPLVAVKLFEMGRLSSGRAAELAAMSRVEFLSNLNRYKVFPLAAELDDLENENV